MTWWERIYLPEIFKGLFITGSFSYQEQEEWDTIYAPNAMGKIGISYTTPFNLTFALFNKFFGNSIKYSQWRRIRRDLLDSKYKDEVAAFLKGKEVRCRNLRKCAAASVLKILLEEDCGRIGKRLLKIDGSFDAPRNLKGIFLRKALLDNCPKYFKGCEGCEKKDMLVSLFEKSEALYNIVYRQSETVS